MTKDDIGDHMTGEIIQADSLLDEFFFRQEDSDNHPIIHLVYIFMCIHTLRFRIMTAFTLI